VVFSFSDEATSGAASLSAPWQAHLEEEGRVQQHGTGSWQCEDHAAGPIQGRFSCGRELGRFNGFFTWDVKFHSSI